MLLDVHNFRGCRSARIEAGPFALVCGGNGSGKSSLCQAAAAVLTGVGVPMVRPAEARPGQLTGLLAKKDCDRIVSDGEAAGYAVLTAADGRDTAKAAWPRADVTRRGSPPQASPIAAGLVRYSQYDAKGRAALLIDLLGAVPSEGDIAAAATAAGASAALIEQTVDRVRADGWDAAAKAAAETATKAKGRWEAVTGEGWGSAKAAAWRPDGWTEDLAQVPLAQLQESVRAATAAAEATAAQEALDRAERDRLAASAAQLDDAERALAGASSRLAAARLAEQDARRHRDSLPAVEGEAGYACPHCGGDLGVSRHPSGAIEIVKFQPTASPQENAERSKALRAADDAVRAAAEATGRAYETGAAATAAVHAARDAQQRLAAAGPEATADQDEARHAAARALSQAMARLDARTRYDAAAAAARSVAVNGALADLLKPTGLRQQTLQERLAVFNAALSAACDVANWPCVAIEADDLRATVGGRALVLACASEVFRADVVLQLACAGRDGSRAVVIDGIDLLDADGRNGLFALLIESGMTALVAMTASAPDSPSVPDLQAIGLGQTYWIEGGIARTLGDARAVAQAAE